jgi:peroxiredoxin Q/BCP
MRCTPPSRSFSLLVALATLAITLLVASAANADLAVGDAAPDFELKGSDGQTYSLEGLLAKHQGVVLAWFPKAFTPG